MSLSDPLTASVDSFVMPSLFNCTKDKQGKKAVDFGVYGIPETILVNKNLIILKKYIGPLNIKDVNEIKKIINQ